MSLPTLCQRCQQLANTNAEKYQNGPPCNIMDLMQDGKFVTACNRCTMDMKDCYPPKRPGMKATPLRPVLNQSNPQFQSPQNTGMQQSASFNPQSAPNNPIQYHQTLAAGNLFIASMLNNFNSMMPLNAMAPTFNPMTAPINNSMAPNPRPSNPNTRSNAVSSSAPSASHNTRRARGRRRNLKQMHDQLNQQQEELNRHRQNQQNQDNEKAQLRAQIAEIQQSSDRERENSRRLEREIGNLNRRNPQSAQVDDAENARLQAELNGLRDALNSSYANLDNMSEQNRALQRRYQDLEQNFDNRVRDTELQLFDSIHGRMQQMLLPTFDPSTMVSGSNPGVAAPQFDPTTMPPQSMMPPPSQSMMPPPSNPGFVPPQGGEYAPSAPPIQSRAPRSLSRPTQLSNVNSTPVNSTAVNSERPARRSLSRPEQSSGANAAPSNSGQSGTMESQNTFRPRGNGLGDPSFQDPASTPAPMQHNPGLNYQPGMFGPPGSHYPPQGGSNHHA